METTEALMGMLFNTALVAMIVATMFGAGLSKTLSDLRIKNIRRRVLVLGNSQRVMYLGYVCNQKEDNCW
jgi:hypothetical protein